jgi:hypothetical protein
MQKGAGVSDDAALKVTELITAANPEHYTAWNYRRRMLLERARNRHATACAAHVGLQTPPPLSPTCRTPLSSVRFLLPLFSCVRVGLMMT